MAEERCDFRREIYQVTFSNLLVSTKLITVSRVDQQLGLKKSQLICYYVNKAIMFSFKFHSLQALKLKLISTLATFNMWASPKTQVGVM